MSSQMMSSGASAPILAPVPGSPPAAPALVPPRPKPTGKKRLGWILVLIAAVIGIERGVNYANRPAAPEATAAAIRTGTVTRGVVERTLRLTGSTGAEKFSSLISPQLRGNRSGGGRDGSFRSGGGSRGDSSSVLQSNSRGGGGGMTSSGGSGGSSGSGGDSSASSASANAVASTNGLQTGGGSQAFRSATSRVGGNRGGSSSASTASSSGASGSSSSSSSSSGSLGSTSGSLIGSGSGGSSGGGGGGFGGGSEFSLVIQDAVKPGSHVKKGDVVAEFDRQYMLTRLDDYRASVSQLDASIRKMKAELEVSRNSHAQTIENAKAALDKAKLDVRTIPVLGAIDAERTRLAAEEAEARYKQLLAEVKFVEIGYQSQIKNAELEVQQAHMELKRAEANADRMLIKAPINGLAVMQTMFRGSEFAQIQVGDQLYPGMMFMQIVDTSSMIINATVNQVDVDNLRIGQKARVRFDAYPDLEVPAHVAAIGAMTRPGGQRASFVKDVPVLLKIDKMDARIIPDLSVSIDVVLESSEQQATVAPLASVFRDGSGADAHVYVKNGAAWDRRNVELGLANNLSVVVRSGLKPGEVVAEDPPPLAGSPPGTKERQS